VNYFLFGTIANKNKNDFDDIINLGEIIIKEKIFDDYLNDKTPLMIKTTEKQLFRHIMKELFIYNRLWSNKKLFFKLEKDDDISKFKLKNKQLSYYTQNFQQPLVFPILEFNEYLPEFSLFNSNNLFKHNLKEVINYDFNLKEENILTKIINKNHPLHTVKANDRVKCCLVKKFYHVKGEIIITKKQKNNYQFNIIFSSNKDENGETCNKNNKDDINDINDTNDINDKAEKNKIILKRIINSNNDKICYGSIFPCLKKEFNKIKAY
jgi:hypothetical protein